MVRQMRSAEPADSSDTSGFKSLLKRATTEMLVLLVLRSKPMYTYEMMGALERFSDGYFSFNTLYIAIYRLKELLFIEESSKMLSDDNRVRVYFSITQAGRNYLNNLIAEYRKFSGMIDIIMSQDEIGKIS